MSDIATEEKTVDLEAKSSAGGATIYIGDKPNSAYYTAAITKLYKNSEVMLVARGKNISKAGGVEEQIKRTLGAVDIDTKWNSEIMDGKDGKKHFVTSVSISIKKSD
jgi:DNA-binding protein Alba